MAGTEYTANAGTDTVSTTLVINHNITSTRKTPIKIYNNNNNNINK